MKDGFGLIYGIWDVGTAKSDGVREVFRQAGAKLFLDFSNSHGYNVQLVQKGTTE